MGNSNESKNVSSESPDVTTNITVCGPCNVGKTYIIEKLAEHHSHTAGGVYNRTVFSQVYHIGLNTLNYGKLIMKIWDTCGSEERIGNLRAIIPNSSVCIFVFSLGSKHSFDDIDKYKQIAASGVEVNDMVYLLIGNKRDLEDREVDINEAEIYAKDNNMMYIEYSAWDDDRELLLNKLKECIEKYRLHRMVN